jgi:signal transduction histidine kinase
MLATALSERLGGAGSEAAGEAERVADLVHQSITHTRSLARGLCPVDLEGEGLTSALRRLSETVSAIPGRFLGVSGRG